MSTSTFVGNSDGLVTGLCPTPPPPPPPPPVPGQVPAMRINTAEPPTIRRPQMASNDAYEPPAAIQNAMLTKDKKPFTYTPGMGGKLDLSQIRSPRMARRVAKNANDEGIEGPPKSALEPRPTPPTNTGASLFVQPQVAIPVFPTNIPVQTAANRTPPTPPTPPINRSQPGTPEKQPESPKAVAKVETKVTPVITIQPNTPESPSTPTQVTLTKAPTPWLQNKNKPQEELPEWAKRSTANKQSASSPDSPVSPPIYAPIQQTPPPQQQQQPPQWQQTQKQQPIQPRPQSMPQQQTQQRPVQIQQQPQQFNQQQKRPYSSPPVAQQASQQTQQERVIPIRIEDRPSVFDVKPEAGHHQFKQPSPHHQQRWGQPTVQSPTQQPAQSQPASGGGFIIPIMMEGNEKKPVGAANSYSQPIVRNNAPNVENQSVKVPQQRIVPVQIQQSDSGPVQSRSFRVLQKITDTDHANDVDTEQMRKLQLTDDDRILMNKFKEQVDNDSSLHHEEDPRYRGAAIPSRAFRFLQTMTDAGEVPVMNPMQRPQSAINKKQNRNSKNFGKQTSLSAISSRHGFLVTRVRFLEETQANLPPSEQQVQEPKKYMGSAIPSRSFRILQAMTAPESVATQENRQADYHCQTENNVPGNQQGVFLPPCPPPFWTPESGWWGYYPLPYPNISNDAYPYHPDNTAYIYFPIYNQNYPYPQHDPTSNKNAYPGVYAPYIVPVPPQIGGNCNRNCGPVGDNVTASKIDPTTTIPAIPENVQDDDVVGSKVSLGDDDVDGLRQWDRPNSMSRTASNTSKDSDCTTAMNITDEEEIPEEIVVPQSDETVQQFDRLETKACPNGSLNVTVPNYTYIDTSDSSDSSDSESQSDNESVIESSKSSSDSNSDDSSSDSDDSDSYLAYSTGLNPHGRSEKDNERNSNENSSSKESRNEGQASEPSSKNNTDCESDAEEQLTKETERTDANTFPHQLSVIYEDVERPDSESPRPQEGRSVRGWNETPFEATDDPPDDSDAPTVSVSLPLRFKFSVSENNEDVTTVIVGDSTIKPERGYIKEESRNTKTQEKVDEVSADFLVKNASVDFTVKKEAVDGKRKGKSHPSERIKEGNMENKAKDSEDPVIPHVNFTLRKIPTRFSKINCEETVETEFTVRRRTSAKKEEARTNKQEDARVNDANVRNSEDSTNKSSTNKESNPTYIATVKETSSKTRDFNSNILKPEVIVSDCNWPDEPSKESTNSKAERTDLSQGSNVSKKSSKSEEYVDEKIGKETKHLLSVQNSRDETDDEDSGVTSDMSRMISEADTDSECTSSRNMRKYQRTQTHSRLFRLLNDDSILPEGAEKTNDSPPSREYLSLPLKNTTFNYDENYCSNYSSGVTSPEYSPVCEQSWRRLHDAENSLVPDQHGDALRQGHSLTRQDRASSKEDPYYQAWKTPKCPTPSMDHDVVPSMAFKVLESKRPLWSYKAPMQRITEQGRVPPSETWHC
ncbi:unnamed protein product [Xylocopa violacea]|uniref:Uncharacterized protein n=1 Tax=Xylocopa violacea TaxID=135666 RepID=A0ABP1PGD7_XYLVO